MRSKAMSVIAIEMTVGRLLVVLIGSQVCATHSARSYGRDKQRVSHIIEIDEAPVQYLFDPRRFV